MPRRVGAQTLMLQIQPSILAGAAVAGKKEGEGPLGRSFDYICQDAYFGESSWEKAESAMLRRAFELACDKAGAAPSELDFILSGDLLNQCAGSAYALRDLSPPYFGLYGACSTMAESLLLGSLLLDGGCGKKVAALTSSHFCSAERQFRFPLEYGSVRTPTSQWTVTGAGALILADKGPGPYVTCVTPGRIVDAGITDSNNMGAAMAPAAIDTLQAHFRDLRRVPQDYDLIVTGDLGALGKKIVLDQFQRVGVDLTPVYDDCGVLIYDPKRQDVHAGGSGCGCGASVLCGYLLDRLEKRELRRLLFCATGALLSPTSSWQGESIPGICHAVAITAEGR